MIWWENEDTSHYGYGYFSLNGPVDLDKLPVNFNFEMKGNAVHLKNSL